MLHNVIQQESILTNDEHLIGDFSTYSAFHFKATILTNIKICILHYAYSFQKD